MSEAHRAFASWKLLYDCPICGQQHAVHKDDGTFVICGDEQFELVLPDTGYTERSIDFEQDWELDS